MLLYKTIRTVRFGIGTVIRLTESQASIRSHALSRLDDDWYVAVYTLEFKAGETIGLKVAPEKGETGLQLIDDDSQDSEKPEGDELPEKPEGDESLEKPTGDELPEQPTGDEPPEKPRKTAKK